MRRGLIVGKFMPLHRGHQLLIESALAQVDDLTVVVYDTKIDNTGYMPIEKRQQWIRQLYPEIENIIALPDTLEGEHTEHDNPIFAQYYADELKFLGQFTHVFSSEDYGQAFAKALGAEHVTVDQARALVPISGTIIRDNPYKYRGFMDPLVYRSLVQKVVFVGTESTGKSTLSKYLADEFDTRWVHEYGRELWQENADAGIEPTFNDFLKVGRTQYQREEAAALHSNRYLFCDTNAWTTLHWSLLYYGTADARLHDLVDRTINDYIWIFCNNEFGWVDDGTRELKDNSYEFQLTQYADLVRRGVKFYTIKGSVEERAAEVRKILANG